MPDESRELVLYVQSKKAITTFYRPATAASRDPISGPSASAAAPGSGEEQTVGEPVFFLSDDQSRCMAMVEEIAAKRGYRVRVVDIEKVGRLERLITEHLRGVSTFPVLISPLGRRLEGVVQFTEDELAAIMPTDLKSVRAFSYLKVRGGDLDRIRRLLESLPEVKELHFLTGDWDILVVLDFPPGASNKRRVLDFVTDRIRGIPEILDTSTVVPEYSLTKFPLT
jgi:DNA-binding Lrp family transcriptional regulator